MHNELDLKCDHRMGVIKGIEFLGLAKSTEKCSSAKYTRSKNASSILHDGCYSNFNTKDLKAQVSKAKLTSQEYLHEKGDIEKFVLNFNKQCLKKHSCKFSFKDPTQFFEDLSMRGPCRKLLMDRAYDYELYKEGIYKTRE